MRNGMTIPKDTPYQLGLANVPELIKKKKPEPVPIGLENIPKKDSAYLGTYIAETKDLPQIPRPCMIEITKTKNKAMRKGL
jgi:hypothetical protein